MRLNRARYMWAWSCVSWASQVSRRKHATTALKPSCYQEVCLAKHPRRAISSAWAQALLFSTFCFKIKTLPKPWAHDRRRTSPLFVRSQNSGHDDCHQWSANKCAAISARMMLRRTCCNHRTPLIHSFPWLYRFSPTSRPTWLSTQIWIENGEGAT